MSKTRLSNSSLACLLGGLAITAVSTICSGAAAASSVVAGLLGWLGGVAGNRFAEIMGRDLDSAEPSSEEIFRNHHIAELIGDGIASVAREHVLKQPRFRTCRDEIEAVANKASAAWLEFIRTIPPEFEPIREMDLPSVLRDFATKGGRATLLEPEDWEKFLLSFTDLPDGGCSLTPEALKAFATALHQHLAESLWNWVKHDFSSGEGKAYVATEMLFLSRILQAVEDIRKNSTCSTAPDVRDLQLRKMLDQGAQRQKELVEQLDEKQTRYFERLFAQSCALVEMLRIHQRALEQLPSKVADELESRRLVRPVFEFKEDISRILEHAPEKLIGREAETKLLSDAWDNAVRGEPNRPLVITFVALGGEGKTSLVAKWIVEEMIGKSWPGCEAAFAWPFFGQASSNPFLNEALGFLGDQKDKEFAASNARSSDKVKRLAEIVRERRTLLILEGLDPLQYAPTFPTPGKLKDQSVAELLRALATHSNGLCVVTTRYSLPDLKPFGTTIAPEVELPRLSREAGVELLRSSGVEGNPQRVIRSADGRELLNEFEKLVEDVEGHALTLNLLGTYLRDFHGGDIRKRDLVNFKDADAANERKDHAFHVLDAYVQSMAPAGFRAWLASAQEREIQVNGERALATLHLLGLFEQPATADCLAALLKKPAIQNLTEPLVDSGAPQRNLTFERLKKAKLITARRDAAGALLSLGAHPLVREYFANRLREQNPEAWRAAHARIFNHYRDSASKDKPCEKLEDFLPLYQAVRHGAYAELYLEAWKVFSNDIQRGKENYASTRLSCYAESLHSINGFIVEPWSAATGALPRSSRGDLLHHAGVCLREMGRFSEAMEASRASFEIAASIGNHDEAEAEKASFRARNIGQIYLKQGELQQAEAWSLRSVEWADKGVPNNPERIQSRSKRADLLATKGDLKGALDLFSEAENIGREYKGSTYLLPGFQGFLFCELLLELGKLDEVERRVTVGISGKGTKPLEIGLQKLILAMWSRRGLGSTPKPDAASRVQAIFDEAVDLLLKAQDQWQLARGLIQRGDFLGTHGHEEAAEADFNDAWEIAERGPMKLFMADIHLYRARAFGRKKDEVRGGDYPWGSPDVDLEAAAEIIGGRGYGRRKKELDDTKRAILGSS